jgi:preprotein translocase subunit SecD
MFGSSRFTGLDAVRAGGLSHEGPAAPAPAPGRHTRRAKAAPAPARESAAVAVLEAEDEVEPPPDDAELSVESVAPSAERVEPSDPAEVSEPEDEAPRSRTTPKPGSAAERAAARRARMRADAGDQKGDR